VALAILAGAVIVFLAVWLGDVRRYNHAVRIGTPAKASRADLQRALSLSRDSLHLRSDATPEIFAAGMLARLGDYKGAVRQAEHVVATQPDYTVGWFFLAQIAAQNDPALYRRAVARLHELRPLTG
jgi:hypothetical protein